MIVDKGLVLFFSYRLIPLRPKKNIGEPKIEVKILWQIIDDGLATKWNIERAYQRKLTVEVNAGTKAQHRRNASE